MKKNILLMIVFTLLSVEANARNLFITQYEYGKMLYENPRGVGCNKCHGSEGKEQFIAKYRHKNKIHKIYTQDITHLSLKRFKQKLKQKTTNKSIMPTYFLTDNEIESIYWYITNNTSD